MIWLLRRYLALSGEERRLLRQAISALGLARLLLAFSFARYARRLGTAQAVTPTDPLPAEQARQASAIARAVERASPYLPWRCLCLVQAVAGKWMCDRYGVPTTLYLGVNKAEGAAGLTAHAWLRAGDQILLGGKEAGHYRTIMTFN